MIYPFIQSRESSDSTVMAEESGLYSKHKQEIFLSFVASRPVLGPIPHLIQLHGKFSFGV
jgi:hypothetical protein